MNVPEFARQWRLLILFFVFAAMVVMWGAFVEVTWELIIDLGKTNWPELEQMRPWPVLAICRQLVEIGSIMIGIPVSIYIFYVVTRMES